MKRLPNIAKDDGAQECASTLTADVLKVPVSKSPIAAIEQAKSASQVRAVFTNSDDQPIVKSTKRLIRVPFKVSRLMEFCNRRELTNQTGHDVWEWPLVVLKELVDTRSMQPRRPRLRR
jgi:hypothetical protein